MKKTTLIRKYLSEYPKMPNLKLARIIYNENNLEFKDVEDVRQVIRYCLGQYGKKDRNLSTIIKSEPKVTNPYNLPDSEEKKYEPFEFSGHKKIGILSDIHFPFHCVETLTEALTYFKKEKVDGILLNGDSIDCHMLSRYVKNPKERDFKYEIDLLKNFFDKLDEILKCKIYFKIGNHELRYEHFLYMKAKEISGIDEIQFFNIIKAREKGIQVIESQQYMKFGNLYGLHGHEYFGSGASNVSKSLYNKAKVNSFQGHNHKTSVNIERNILGESITTYSIGCCCRLHPAYLPLNFWNNGCAMIELDGDNYQFHNKIIENGKML